MPLAFLGKSHPTGFQLPLATAPGAARDAKNRRARLGMGHPGIHSCLQRDPFSALLFPFPKQNQAGPQVEKCIFLKLSTNVVNAQHLTTAVSRSQHAATGQARKESFLGSQHSLQTQPQPTHAGPLGNPSFYFLCKPSFQNSNPRLSPAGR